MLTGLAVILILTLPPLTFVLLSIGERLMPTVAMRYRETRGDMLINLSGFAMQGAIVPAIGYLVSHKLLPQAAPAAEGILGLGFWGSFLLCLVGVDFLYYWQHRLFHRIEPLWRMHRCHHAAPALSVWATARNSLLTHFLFVYLLINPWLAYLSGSIEGFLLAASVTASLDLWRHSRLLPAFYWSALEWLLITPRLHHLHHDASDPGHNFAANLSLWDRMFGTLRSDKRYPVTYAVADAPDRWSQLLYPLTVRRKLHTTREA